MRRLDPEQLVRLGNAAYGAGLCFLMLGERKEAAEWLGRASARWRESWEHATPTSWGRPIGVIKAALIAGNHTAASAFGVWALGLGCAEAESPIGRYAATLALLVEGRDNEALPVSQRACEATRFRSRSPTRSPGSQAAPQRSTEPLALRCSRRSRAAPSTWRTFRSRTP